MRFNEGNLNFESVEHANSWVLILANSSERSEKAMISVGHTKVLKKLNKKDCFYRCYDCLQVKRIEEQHHVLALVVSQRDGLEVAVHDGIGCEVGRRLSNLGTSGRHFQRSNVIVFVLMVSMIVVVAGRIGVASGRGGRNSSGGLHAPLLGRELAKEMAENCGRIEWEYAHGHLAAHSRHLRIFCRFPSV